MDISRLYCDLLTVHVCATISGAQQLDITYTLLCTK